MCTAITGGKTIPGSGSKTGRNIRSSIIFSAVDRCTIACFCVAARQRSSGSPAGQLPRTASCSKSSSILGTGSRRPSLWSRCHWLHASTGLRASLDRVLNIVPGGKCCLDRACDGGPFLPGQASLSMCVWFHSWVAALSFSDYRNFKQWAILHMARYSARQLARRKKHDAWVRLITCLGQNCFLSFIFLTWTGLMTLHGLLGQASVLVFRTLSKKIPGRVQGEPRPGMKRPGHQPNTL